MPVKRVYLSVILCIKVCDVFIMNVENYRWDRDFDVRTGGTAGLTRKK